MIVAVSTSSPQSSVALIDPDGTLLASGEELSPRRASGTCLRLLERLLRQTGRELESATLFAADLGPGSFTGVKVGVTLAKVLAFTHGRPAAGASSFDLISREQTAILPSKRGEWFVRRLGEEPFRSQQLPSEPWRGYGPDIEQATYPHASEFRHLLRELRAAEPERLVPLYLIEPSISTPKQPYGLPQG